jgi:hypothetical protein
MLTVKERELAAVVVLPDAVAAVPAVPQPVTKQRLTREHIMNAETAYLT